MMAKARAGKSSAIPENEQREEALTVTKSGMPAATRFPSCRLAIAKYRKMRERGEMASVARANIQGAFDGNPPYSRSELVRHGIEWMTNIDWGEFRAAINRNVSSVWNMFNSVPAFLRLTPKSPSRDNLNPSKDWGIVLANEYTRTLRAWDGYHYLTRTRLMEMFKFGVGWVFWPDEYDWRSRFVRSSNVLFEASARATIGGIEVLMMRDEMTLTAILKTIEDQDAADDAGWNVPYLRKKLVSIFRDGNRQDFQRKYAVTDWESVQQSTKNNDFFQDISEFDPLRIVHLLALHQLKSESEDGKPQVNSAVQQAIFIEDDSDDQNSKFIYNMTVKGKASIEEFSQPMMFNTGDGYMSSVRGYGREIFHFAHASNRLMNSILTGVDIASGLLIQGQTTNSLERMAITKAGPITRIPQSMTILQQQYMPNINSAADARQIIQALQNNNTGMYQNRSENTGPARTAEEVRVQAANEARFENDQAEWYYIQHERWHQQTFRRLLRKDYKADEPGYAEHMELKKRLKDAGMPAEMMDPDHWNVAISRAIGLGSTSMRLSITNDMVGMSGRLDEAGRRNVDKEWFAARVNYDNVPFFVSDQSRDQIPTIDHAMSESENVDMLSGNPRTATVDDAHKHHMDMHLRMAGDVIERFQAGQLSPEQALQALYLDLQHMQAHIEMMQQDKSREPMIKFYMQAMQQYSQVAQQIKAIVDQNAKNQQQQQEEQQKTLQEAEQTIANREFEAEKYKIDQNVALEKYKADLLNEARVSKSMAAVQANQMRLEQEIQALQVRTMSEIERKAAESAAKIETMRQQMLAKERPGS